MQNIFRSLPRNRKKGRLASKLKNRPTKSRMVPNKDIHGMMAKMHKKIALRRPLDQRINDRIRPEENYIACSKLFLVDLLAPILHRGQQNGQK